MGLGVKLENETYHFSLNVKYKLLIVSLSHFVLFMSQFEELAESGYCSVY
jgi:hypothetical protein